MLATPIVVRYPLDRTGVDPNNRVENEEHQTPNRKVRAIAPFYGPFYTESLVVREKSTQRVLTRGVDYIVAELYEVPTAMFGKEVCAIVLITNGTVLNDIQLTYQVVGGEFSTSSQAIVQMVMALDLDDRPVSWGNIIGKPAEFDPAPHLHDIGDIYGFEYLVQALENIKRAILIGDAAAHDEIYRYIDAAIAELRGMLDASNEALTNHIQNRNNPHGTTAEHVNTYIKTVIDAKDTAIFDSLKVLTQSVAPGTTMNSRTYAQRWNRITGSGTIAIAANTFLKDDVIYLRALGAPLTIVGSGVQLNFPSDRNNVLHSQGGNVAIIFNSPNNADVTGDLQWL